MNAQSALKFAILDQIRLATASDGLGILKHDCAIMLDGRPEPRWSGSSKGRVFYSVHGGARSKIGADSHLQVEYHTFVTLSMLTSAPFDRVATEQIVKDIDGMDEKIDLCVATLHNAQWSIMQNANDRIGSNHNGFCEALYPTGWEEPQPVGEEWFCASIKGSSQGMFVGLKSTISFSGALRVQLIGSSGA